VTFTVSDGVTSVSNVATLTIAGAAVPIPFWQLILSADCVSYSLDSARAQLQAFAESGSYWRDSVATSPLVVAETGVYWLDSVEAAIAETGSYWLDSAVASPLIVAETGVYWLDSVEAAIADDGSYSLDSAVQLQSETTSWISRVQGLGGQPTTAALSAVDAFFVAIKSQSYYANLKLLQLFAGTTTIASAMAPLLHPSNTAATLTGFTGSDYTASGSGAGIQGNGTNYINHNYSPYANTPGSSVTIGTYSKTGGGFDVFDVGFQSATDYLSISSQWSNGNFYADSITAFEGRVAGTSPGGTGMAILTRVSATDARYFFGGTQQGLTTTTTPSMSSNINAFYSFSGGSGSNISPRKLTFSFAATGLTPADVANFSTAVATLVGSL